MSSLGQPRQATQKPARFYRRPFWRLSIALAGLGLGVLACSTPQSNPASSTPAKLTLAPAPSFAEFQKTVQPFLAAHCYECHGPDDSESGVRLDQFASEADLAKGMPTLERALKMLTARKMPPKDEPRPTEDEYHTVIAWMDAYSNKFYLSGPIDPGRVTLHRLNRAEYDNTIHDLLAIDFNPADAFPVDDAGYGFDNNGDVLSIAPVLLEKYITAASLSLKKAVFADPVGVPPVQQFDAATAEGDFPKSDPKAAVDTNNVSGGRAPPNPVGRVFQYFGNVYVAYDFPVEGDYVFNFRAYFVAGNGQAKSAPVAFYLDGSDKPIGKDIQINSAFNSQKVYSTEPTHVTAGKHYVYLSFRSNTTHEQYLAALNAPPVAPPTADADVAPVVAVNSPAAEAKPAEAPAIQPATPAPANAPVAVAAADAVPAPTPSAANNLAAAVTKQASATGAAAQPAASTPAPASAQGPAIIIASASAAPAAATGARGARGAGGGRGRNPGPTSVTGNAILGVVYLEVEGPEFSTASAMPERMPESYHRVMVAQPSPTVTKAQAAEKIIRNFAYHAYRRPVTDDEVKSLMELWKSVDVDNRPLEESVSVVLQAVLASPDFLFRVEQDPQPGEQNNIHTLNEYELASRLSYFLWSSMPDDELFALAAKGQLRANLDAQVTRMLKSPKAQALVQNFAGQWLRLRQVENVSPDPKLYPAFDQDLRESMLTETQMFFSSIKDEDRSVLDFIDANYTFVNGRLAKFYGLDGNITGDDFQRVTFPQDSERGGLLTQASILTLTSYNNRTSPVQRGKWVLENLLDAAPPPPPPNVPVLDSETQLKGTLRQQMEQHRANPVCAACHERMDAIGFSLENFDAIGGWRDKDAQNVPIDASGTLPDGKTFTGARQLKQILLLQQDQFCRCLADKMLIYALGRGTEPSDKRTIDGIVSSMQKNGDKFSALVKAIAHSDAFQKRRGPLPGDNPQPDDSSQTADNPPLENNP